MAQEAAVDSGARVILNKNPKSGAHELLSDPKIVKPSFLEYNSDSR